MKDKISKAVKFATEWDLTHALSKTVLDRFDHNDLQKIRNILFERAVEVVREVRELQGSNEKWIDVKLDGRTLLYRNPVTGNGEFVPGKWFQKHLTELKELRDRKKLNQKRYPEVQKERLIKQLVF